MTSCGIPGAHCMCVLSFVLLLASADGFSLTSSAVQPTRWLSTGARHLAFARPVPVVRVWRHGSGKCQMTGASTDRRLVVSKLLTWTVGVSVWGGAGGVAWAAAESTESAAERTAGATATLKKQQEAETENLKNSKLGQLLLKRTEQNKEKNAAGIRSRICSVQCPGKPLGREAVTELEAYCQDCR
eukprot:CAMPEP_0180197216 /NCGR_PEP_ID=MMETSP0987-20121128/4520_1 /TAXON_ID=697907 /ORGANISM="non described non described, Strain CCMP2293" /LENGTH=185 /DNA_ID=CAMNT_0022152145 /DNA_START=52 /DNA_END=606 /DNA_ORIENTATION=+